MGGALTSIELCAGAGGQALGLDQSGFQHECLVEIDSQACATLRTNRPNWNVWEGDLKAFRGGDYKGIDLVAAGLPCPPFSVAGKQLGALDERNLFPPALEIIGSAQPKAVMIENVRGFLGGAFEDYRLKLKSQLRKMGYWTDWRLLNASDFGVPQLRPRVVIVAIKRDLAHRFSWDLKTSAPPTVGEALFDLMAEKDWRGVGRWKAGADDIAPTIVGGSHKHGGPDLGPTRARSAWQTLGVNGKSIAEEAPDRDYVGLPRLTVRMVARLQGFPDDWTFSGRKTAAYRQVGNAFPPPVARAVASQIFKAIHGRALQYKVA